MDSSQPSVIASQTEESVQAARERFERQYNEIAALAGGLAHEVRNPLSTIRLNLDLLFEDLARIDHPTSHRILKKLQTIQDQCGHLEDILEAFLQFTRAGELHLEPVELSEVLRRFLEYYKPEADRHGLDLRPHVAGDLPPVKIDRRLFKQVLDNLLRNAQQAMPQGGAIELQAYSQDKCVCLEVIDTGCGIPEPDADRIFDVFYSTKPSGNGLGLPTVRKIVESHGGTIQCESAPGRGTKFTICLPAQAETAS